MTEFEYNKERKGKPRQSSGFHAALFGNCAGETVTKPKLSASP